MPWTHAITSWAAHLRRAGYPTTTVRTRTQHVSQLAREVPGTGPWEHTTDTLVDWMATHEWKPESWHAARSSLRAFYSWGHRAGHVGVDLGAGIPRRRRTTPNPRPASDRAVAVALSRATPREALMVRLAAHAGLRRGEIARVHTADLVDDLLGWSLVVHGKGGKERTVPLPDRLALDLVAHGGGRAGYVFPGRVDGHLSPQWVGDLLARLLPPPWTAHTLRHRFATRAYSVDRDVLTVQSLLGHASPTTTQRYVQLDPAAARRTVDAVSSAPGPRSSADRATAF